MKPTFVHDHLTSKERKAKQTLNYLHVSNPSAGYTDAVGNVQFDFRKGHGNTYKPGVRKAKKLLKEGKVL